jgi:hypothetical protein
MGHDGYLNLQSGILDPECINEFHATGSTSDQAKKSPKTSWIMAQDGDTSV